MTLVLLTLDCWRGDHFLGGASLTPHLDQLAAESTVYSRAYTAGGCTRAAMTALFSSTYASMYGGLTTPWAVSRPILSECLQQAGYATAGLSTNVFCGSPTGFSRGFDTFADLAPNLAPGLRHRWSRRFVASHAAHLPGLPWLMWYAGGLAPPPSPHTPAQEVTDAAIAWLSQPGQNRFLWVHYMDVHWPYRGSRRPLTGNGVLDAWRDRARYRHIGDTQGRWDPGADCRARWQALYGEELMGIDAQIGRLLAHLRDSGQWAETALVVTSDHGEEFFEHGTWGHAWNQLFDEGARVPLIVHQPGQTTGRTLDQVVSHLDLAPTLLDIAGQTKPDGMLGNSLLQPLADTPVYTEMVLPHRPKVYRLAIRTSAHTYIYDIGHPHQRQLYDVRTDPGETRNLCEAQPKRLRHFDTLRFQHVARGLLQTMERREPDDGDPVTQANIDPILRQRLEALGYL